MIKHSTKVSLGIGLGIAVLSLFACNKDNPIQPNQVITNYPIYLPFDITVDTAGNMFITNSEDYTIIKVSSAGAIKTYAGTYVTSGYSGDGGLALNAKLGVLTGITMDKSGNIYFTDNTRIRTVNASTKIINTVAGNGVAGYSGDGAAATAAGMNVPAGVTVDTAGNLYITDFYNNRVRKVTAKTGIITTIAGNGTGGYTGDGGAATAAELHDPDGITIDDSNNIYIGDRLNNVVRKVNAITGNISTVAGNGATAYGGDGNPATSVGLSVTGSIAVDTARNLYITDQANFRVYQVNSKTHIITTVAGTGQQGNAGDGGPATAAHLDLPTGVFADKAGNLYIVDQGSSCVRFVNATTHIITTVVHN